MPLTKGIRSDRLSLSVMPVQPDITEMLAKPNEESYESVHRHTFDFDSIINGLFQFLETRGIRKAYI